MDIHFISPKDVNQRYCGDIVTNPYFVKGLRTDYPLWASVGWLKDFKNQEHYEIHVTIWTYNKPMKAGEYFG